MMTSTLFAAGLLASAASLGFAQEPTPGQTPPPIDQPDPAPQLERRSPPPMEHREAARHHREGGPSRDRRDAPPPRTIKGFDLRLGETNWLRVNCGDEALEACIEAVMPLVDSVNGAMGATPGAPPPPN